MLILIPTQVYLVIVLMKSLREKGNKHDSDFEQETEVLPKKVNIRKNAPVVRRNGKCLKRKYTVQSYIDFTQGQTRVKRITSV